MSRPAIFEIVQTDSGWTARFRYAGNRKIGWSTGSQVYATKADAQRAIDLLCEAVFTCDEVREVDERGQS